MNFLFISCSNKSGKISGIIYGISLVFVLLVVFIYIESFNIVSRFTMVENINKKYLLRMETDGYLNEDNQYKLTKELENLGINNINFNETTKTKTENNIVVLSVKGNYKNKELNSKMTSRYYSLK